MDWYNNLNADLKHLMWELFQRLLHAFYKHLVEEMREIGNAFAEAWEFSKEHPYVAGGYMLIAPIISVILANDSFEPKKRF